MSAHVFFCVGSKDAPIHKTLLEQSLTRKKNIDLTLAVKFPPAGLFHTASAYGIIKVSEVSRW